MILHTAHKCDKKEEIQKFKDWNDTIDYIRNNFESTYYNIRFLSYPSGKIGIYIDNAEGECSYFFEEIK